MRDRDHVALAFLSAMRLDPAAEKKQQDQAIANAYRWADRFLVHVGAHEEKRRAEDAAAVKR